jgi:hypothetical protein
MPTRSERRESAADKDLKRSLDAVGKRRIVHGMAPNVSALRCGVLDAATAMSW